MPLIIFSSNVIASRNIAEQIIPLGFEKINEDEWHYIQKTNLNQDKKVLLLDCKSHSILDIPTNFNTDCIIVLSSHKSRDAKQTLTAHFPGNWNEAKFGGKPKTLNIAYSSMLKNIIKEMHRLVEEHRLELTVSLEVDHHGPTCDVPIIYAELGNNEQQYGNTEGAKVVAEAVFAAVNSDKKFESVFGIGGGHYPAAFNKIMFDADSNLAVGHILPKYHFEALNEEMFRQAIEKNVEKVTHVLVMKKEFNLEQKKKVKELADKFNVVYEEI